MILLGILKGFAPAAGPLTCRNSQICNAVSWELQVLYILTKISCESRFAESEVIAIIGRREYNLFKAIRLFLLEATLRH